MRRIAFSLACASVLAIAAFHIHASANSDSTAKPMLLASRPDPVRFSPADNTQVRVYFAHNPLVWTGVPPELARDFGLGKELPRGLSMEPLPPGLVARLSAHPGYGYARVGQDVAMIENTTRVVVDIIEDVFD